MEGIGEKRLKKALHDAGYSYRNQGPKGWYYLGEGEEPLDQDVFGYVKSSSPSLHDDVNSNSREGENNTQLWNRVEIPSPKGKINVKHNSTVQENVEPISLKAQRTGEVIVKRTSREDEMNVKEDYSRLMYEELMAIRGLLQAGETKVKEIAPDNLLERISGLNRAVSKTRKTIVIDDEIARQLDEFAKKKRVNKSDLLEVALLDLFEMYQ